MEQGYKKRKKQKHGGSGSDSILESLGLNVKLPDIGEALTAIDSALADSSNLQNRKALEERKKELERKKREDEKRRNEQREQRRQEALLRTQQQPQEGQCGCFHSHGRNDD